MASAGAHVSEAATGMVRSYHVGNTVMAHDGAGGLRPSLRQQQCARCRGKLKKMQLANALIASWGTRSPTHLELRLEIDGRESIRKPPSASAIADEGCLLSGRRVSSGE